MLAGRSNLARCHSSTVLRAHLRLTSSILRYDAGLVNHSRVKHLPHHIPTHRTIQVTYLSHSTPLSADPRQQAAKYLKERRKPRFRLRKSTEDDEFAEALKGLEAQYATQIAIVTADRHKNIRGRHTEESDPEGDHFATFVDNYAPQSQHEIESRTVLEFTRQHWRPAVEQRSRKDASTAELENELHYQAQSDPNPTAIFNILNILIRDRKIKPKPQYYEALILANTWPEYGSLEEVENVLAEMEREGMEINANIVVAVLKVLAIRPSSDLNCKVMALVERKWIQLSSEESFLSILSMIRLGQIELAMWTLDTLRSKGKLNRNWDREIIPDYLVVLLIAEMVRVQDWEGILRYSYKLRNRRAADREIPVEFWGWLLERVAKAARRITESAISAPESKSRARINVTDAAPSRPTILVNNNSTSIAQHNDYDQDQAYIQSQLSLSNPAYHLTTFLFTNYVTNMSHRPSYTTLLNILHCATNTGTPWLAHSAVATMTYMDGIDDTGLPITHLSNDIKDLVTQAEVRALANETEEEKTAKTQTGKEKQEKEKVLKEDEEWWAELMNQLAEEEEAIDRVDRNSDGESDRVSSDFKPNPASTSTSTTTSNGPRQSPTPSDCITTSSRSPSTPTTTPPYHALPHSHLARGNLWPLFPPQAGTKPHLNPDSTVNMSDLKSAYTDSWDALGPRMAARSKWTDAQAYVKGVMRGERRRRF